MAQGSVARERPDRSWPAVLGWGSLIVFSLGFVWVVSTQLGENWARREADAIRLAKEFRPAGSPHDLEDLTKVFSSHARERDTYVGEFQWRAVQKDGPEYEVTLLWKEGQKHRVALWRVDLQSGDVRPQGEEAASLPARALSSGAKS